jgi:APA family basic amino acid/polyamine antiporter
MSIGGKFFVREATGLVRAFGFFDLVFLSLAGTNFLGALVSTMLYAPYFYPGANLTVVFAVGTLPALAVAAVYGMLGRAMPRTGGDYVWSTRIMGPLFGIIQWVLLFGTLVILIAEFVVILPITIFLQQLLFSLGVTLNNPGLINAASSATQPSVGLPLNLIYLALGMAIALSSTRVFVRIQRYAWALYFVILVVLVISLLSLNPSKVSSLFDHSMQIAGSNATYSGVIQQATSGGLSAGFSVTNTLLAILPWGFFSFIGFNWSTYLSGEVKNAKTVITRALATAVIIMGAVLAITAVIAYNAAGSDFLSSASYIAATNPAYLPSLPTITLLVSLINPYLAFVIGVGMLIALLVTVAGLTLNLSRMIFAASFDRILPKKLAEVNERFQSPQWAVLLVGVCYAILITLFWLTSWASLFLNTALVIPLGSALPFVAALAFYFKKPKLFEQTLGGRSNAVKLILLSAVGLAMFATYTFAEIVPINSGMYLGASLSIAFEIACAFVIIGIVLYAASRYRLRGMGIELNKIYDEIPPE